VKLVPAVADDCSRAEGRAHARRAVAAALSMHSSRAPADVVQRHPECIPSGKPIAATEMVAGFACLFSDLPTLRSFRIARNKNGAPYAPSGQRELAPTGSNPGIVARPLVHRCAVEVASLRHRRRRAAHGVGA